MMSRFPRAFVAPASSLPSLRLKTSFPRFSDQVQTKNKQWCTLESAWSSRHSAPVLRHGREATLAARAVPVAGRTETAAGDVLGRHEQYRRRPGWRCVAVSAVQAPPNLEPANVADGSSPTSTGAAALPHAAAALAASRTPAGHRAGGIVAPAPARHAPRGGFSAGASAACGGAAVAAAAVRGSAAARRRPSRRGRRPPSGARPRGAARRRRATPGIAVQEGAGRLRRGGSSGCFSAEHGSSALFSCSV